jgi:hypothetical protein
LVDEKRSSDYAHIIFKAFAKVVTTKGSESQNHGLRDGRVSIIIITIAETKK